MTERLPREEREALIAGQRDGALGPDEAAELALLAELLADPATWAEPSPALEDAVVRAVAEAGAPATTPTTPGAASARRPEPPRGRRILAAAGAAAAAIALVVTGAVVLLTGGGTAPDYAAQLAATGLAPRAHASADITRTNAGFRVTLDANGLPPLPADEYYQGWLENSAGTLVPIGTFSSSDGRVTLWSGVSPRDFHTITVTIEARDNDQSSSGRRVLVGELRAG
jgi:hypothetical protein